MRRNKTVAICAVAVIMGAMSMLQSCNKLANLLNVNLSMQTESVNVTIPVTTDTAGTITVGPATTEFNVDSFIRSQTANQLGAANINSVKLTSVTFSLTNANSANNFQDFESVAASFSSNTDASPYNISIPSNADVYATSLSLPIDSTVELKNYIGSAFTYYVSGKLRRPTTIPLNCTITFTFSLNVKG